MSREITPEQWRIILRESIENGQEAALLALVIAYGIIGFRALISCLQQYFRSNVRPPAPLRWDVYGNRLAKLIDKIKEGLCHRDLRAGCDLRAD